MKVPENEQRSVGIDSLRPAEDAPRGAGRPRDSRIDTEVVAAVLDALRSGGYRAVTFDGLAGQLGRARTSLYRRWPSKRHLVAYAVVSEMGDNPASDTGNLRKDLEAAADNLRLAFSGPMGGALAGLTADMAQDADLGATIREQVLAPRRQSMRLALKRGQGRGEASRTLDMELVLDMLTGPFYFRTLFGHAPLSKKMSRQVVNYVLRVVTPRASQTR